MPMLVIPKLLIDIILELNAAELKAPSDIPQEKLNIVFILTKLL